MQNGFILNINFLILVIINKLGKYIISWTLKKLHQLLMQLFLTNYSPLKKFQISSINSSDSSG